MAYRKSSAIGDLHGRVENMIFRTRNGKNVAYARPLNQKIPNSKKAVYTRQNFAAANSLGSSVNSVPGLQEIWSTAKVPGSNSYQKLISMNTSLAREGRLSASNVITPPGEFIKLNSASLENEMLLLSFLCPESSKITFPARLFVYLYFENADKKIVPLAFEMAEPEPGGNYELEIVPDITVKNLLARDPSPLVFIALAGGTINKRKPYWTGTAALQM